MIMTVFLEENNHETALSLHDLLVDEKEDELSEYLSLSIENLGSDTVVTVTTVEDIPITYSTTLSGVSISSLQYMVDAEVDSII
jgi:hypothetical protein